MKKIKFNLLILLLTIPLNTLAQTQKIKINGVSFSFMQTKPDTTYGAENETIELYRKGKKRLTHTLFKEESDCSSIHIQLGSYKIIENNIIFYSFWAAADRMPNSILPFGFRQQTYAVDNLGALKLIDAKIYIETIVTTKNKNFLEENGWKHKGLKYLNKKNTNKFEQKLITDYVKNAEKEYNASFVFNSEKEALEKKVRSILKEKIKTHTQDWEAKEVYGRVKK